MEEEIIYNIELGDTEKASLLRKLEENNIAFDSHDFIGVEFDPAARGWRPILTSAKTGERVEIAKDLSVEEAKILVRLLIKKATERGEDNNVIKTNERTEIIFYAPSGFLRYEIRQLENKLWETADINILEAPLGSGQNWKAGPRNFNWKAGKRTPGPDLSNEEARRVAESFIEKISELLLPWGSGKKQAGKQSNIESNIEGVVVAQPVSGVSVVRSSEKTVIERQEMAAVAPESSYKEAYDNYINSDAWKNKKIELENIYRRNNWDIKCIKCGAMHNLEPHHNYYMPPSFHGGHENISDLDYLCKDCHDEWHKIQRRSGSQNSLLLEYYTFIIGQKSDQEIRMFKNLLSEKVKTDDMQIKKYFSRNDAVQYEKNNNIYGLLLIASVFIVPMVLAILNAIISFPMPLGLIIWIIGIITSALLFSKNPEPSGYDVYSQKKKSLEIKKQCLSRKPS